MAATPALAQENGDRLNDELLSTGVVRLSLEGETVELGEAELDIRLIEKEGLATSGSETLLVALDTSLSPELVAEGLAREVVHRIQTARKQANLDYADRISVRWVADGELAAAIERHAGWIAGETLAREITASAPESPDLIAVPIDDHDLSIAIERLE